jgi:hypothetical protein
MDHHWIWSNGCARQFQNPYVFQWLCMLQNKYKVPHIWNYFDIRNGKGEHDGVGTCIKNTLCRKQMRFTTIYLIQNAKSIVKWCSLVMT